MEKFFNPNEEHLEEMKKQLGITYANWRQRIKELPSASISANKRQQAFNWCKENFDLSWAWSSRIGTDECIFYFKDESQLLRFILKFETLQM